MLEKELIINHIKKNINLFDQLEFCNTGGWPNFDSLDVLVYSEIENEKGRRVKLSILYQCDHSASCACYSTSTTPDSLRKEIFIGNDGEFEIF